MKKRFFVVQWIRKFDLIICGKWFFEGDCDS
jgi:hypothetical protein